MVDKSYASDFKEKSFLATVILLWWIFFGFFDELKFVKVQLYGCGGIVVGWVAIYCSTRIGVYCHFRFAIAACVRYQVALLPIS